MFQLILTRIKRINDYYLFLLLIIVKLLLLSTKQYIGVGQQLLYHTPNSWRQEDIKICQVYSWQTQFVEFFSSSFFRPNRRTWAEEVSGLSALYHSNVTQILRFERSTTSTTLWTSFCCSSMSSDSVDWRNGDKFCSLRKLSAATTCWFLCRINWLKSASPVKKVCLSQIFAFIFSLEHFQYNIQIVEVIFVPRKLSKSVLTLAKVHIVGTS